MYKCKHCGVDKSFESFNKDSRCKLGINLTCKDCCNEKRRKRYANEHGYRDYELARGKRYVESGYYRRGFCKNAREINDSYAISAIIRGNSLRKEDLPQELIDAWKELLKVKRLKKQIQNEIKQRETERGAL